MLSVLQKAPTPKDRSTGRRIWVIVVAAAYLACLYLLIRYAWYFWVHADALIQFPYEMDYGEGPLLHQARLLARGEWPYQDIFRQPFIVGNYPPVYTGLMALGIKLSGAVAFAGARWLSTGATLLSGVLIGLIVHRMSGRAWAGAVSGLLWFSLKYVYVWGALARVDNLALFWSLLGFWWVVQFHRSRQVYWSVLFFLLAVYTRQSMIAAAAAAYLWLLTQDRHRALVCMAGCAAGGLALFGLLQWVTEGEFYNHIVTYNRNEWSWASTQNWFRQYWGQDHHQLFTLLGAAGGVASLFTWRRSGAAGLFVAVSWLTALTVGKIGSNVNYLLEALAATSIGAGLLMGRMTEQAETRRSAWWVEILIPVMLFLQLLVWAHEPLTGRDWSFTPFPGTGWEQQRVVERIRQAPADVISENMGLLVLAGKEIAFQPFELTQIARDGNWDEQLIIERVRRQEMSMIVLEFDAENETAWGWRTSRFSPTLLQMIDQHYQRTARLGQWRIYVPR